MHICDSAAAKTHDTDDILELARVISNKIAPDEKMQITKLKVAKDILAQGQALMLLFPKAARLIARREIEQDNLDLKQLEKIICIPIQMLEEMLDPDWEDIAESLTVI